MTRSKRTLFGLTIFLILSFLCCPRAFAAEGERVLRMDVDVHVSPNATLTVTERIVYMTDRPDIRGFYRSIPTERKRGGTRVKSIFKLVSATRNGRETPYTLKRGKSSVYINFDDGQYFSPNDAYEYTLQYTLTDRLLFHENVDELYWNAISYGWSLPIETASFRVFLPNGATIKKQDAWTGASGEKGNDWKVSPAGRLETTRGLAPHEGFTVSTRWDKGFVTPPTEIQRLLMQLEDWAGLTRDKSKAFLAAKFRTANAPFENESRVGFAFCVALVVVAYASVSHFLGRDPRKKNKGTRPFLFSPPCPEAAYAGYVKTLAFDEGLLLADLVQLAVQGQIRLGPRKDHLKVEKAVAEWSADVSPAHRKLLQALFRRDETSVNLGGTTKDDISAAWNLVEQMPEFYKTGSRAQYSKAPRLVSSHAVICTALLVLFVPLLYAAFAMDSPLSPLLMGGRELLAFWISVVALPLLLLWLAWRLFREARRDWRAAKRTLDAKTLLIAVKWTPVLLFALLLAGAIKSLFLSPIRAYLAQDPLLVVGLWLAFGSACFVFASMPVRTREGWRLLEQVEGFETYLKAAENDSIQQLSPMQQYALPQMTPERYEALLPYAIALAAADTWTEAAILQLSRAKYQPTWYRGGFNLQTFTKSLLKSANTMRPTPFAQGMERLMKYGERKQR